MQFPDIWSPVYPRKVTFTPIIHEYLPHLVIGLEFLTCYNSVWTVDHTRGACAYAVRNCMQDGRKSFAVPCDSEIRSHDQAYYIVDISNPRHIIFSKEGAV